MSTSYFQDMLGKIAERGRDLLDSPAPWSSTDKSGRKASKRKTETIDELARALLSGRGEASGVALAKKLLDTYEKLPTVERVAFFHRLADDFGPDRDRLRKAWTEYDASPDPKTLKRLLRDVEPPRQELFRRLNLAPGGTRAVVAMREDLIKHGGGDPALDSVEEDLVHLLYSWFNRGFLVMQRITWSSPADILERLIRYEAVHTIRGWDDLRTRVQPPDRRCYAFFHPALVDEPLIFVEVALTREIPGSIQGILADEREVVPPEQATTAVFYSISNCQSGLRGISFGNFLIKQVVEDISRDLPNLDTFVTLSPVPGFSRWLKEAVKDPGKAGLPDADLAPLAALDQPGWQNDEVRAEALRPLLTGLAATYYLEAKGRKGQPVDPVARFHLGNGARLERINWLGDVSDKGIREGEGFMVNYLYDLDTIEANHEAFANEGSIAASSAVRRHLRDFQKLGTREARRV